MQMRVVILIFKLLFSFGFAEAQVFAQALRIDSVVVIPANPTTSDEVQIIVYSFATHGSCDVLNSALTINNNTIEIEAEYPPPGWTVECYNVDTFNLGKLCRSNYTFIFKPYAMVGGTVKTYWDSARVSFIVIGTPGQYPINLPEQISLCENNVILDAGYYPEVDYLWNTGETTQQINVLERGVYIVKLFKGNCEELADTTIATSDCELFFPNAFTPNEDGVNDIFVAKGIDIKKFEITIYDRWGRKIYYSATIHNCWDGFINGHPAPNGLYIWQATYYTSEAPSSYEVKTGQVTLLR